MPVEVDVFVGSNSIIDFDIYQIWLDGHSANDAVQILIQRGIDQQCSFHITSDMIMSDVQDHYVMFQLLEKYLQNPTKFGEQWTFQLDDSAQKMLIRKYYEFKDEVVREILGKKLSSRNRKDLDEVSEKTNVTLKSCRRQFDNIKRVFKAVEEIPGCLMQNIQQTFLLPDNLGREYSALVFIANQRFETNKKKLHYVTFKDFLNCANLIIKKCDMDVDIDRVFLRDLREMKSLLDRENIEEYKNLVFQDLQDKVSTKIMSDIDTNFKNISRTFVNIAYGLNHSKEVRDIFIDLVDKSGSRHNFVIENSTL
ncbi:Acidic fibroblast growth factor intracellular-binding protein [Nymphon striatum]|nr:Acidic fibroblast growth factor intracellular-binding protein [Nymphon striatum]